MNDRLTLILSGILTVLFFVSGVLNILDYFIIKLILLGLLLTIITSIIIVKSKDDTDTKKPLE